MYNTQEYIKETLESIIVQKFDGIEIIVIDDESSDNSVEIVKEIQKKYLNIKLFEQLNQGPSIARNLGLNNANGEYIMFLDSDDLLEKDALNRLYSAINENNSDVVIGLYRSFSIKNMKGSYHSFAKSLVGLEFFNKSLDDIPKMIVSLPVWNKIYRRTFLNTNSIRFHESIHLREDALFMANVFALSDKISHIPFDVTLYRIRESNNVSLTHVINPKVFDDIIYVSGLIDGVLKSRNFLQIDEINKRRYTTELIAINFRLEKFLEEESAQTSDVLESICSYLQKVDDKTISIFSFKNRMVLFLLKYAHFERAKEMSRTKLSLETFEQQVVLEDNSINSLFIREQYREINALKAPRRTQNISIKKQIKNLFNSIKKKSIKNSRAFLRKNYINLLENIITLLPKNRDIWLIGERLGNSAQDTGWQFFNYCRDTYPNEAIYFVTKKKQINTQMKLNKNIVIYGSFKHTIILLSAKVHIFNDSYRDLCKRWDKLRTTKQLEVSCFLQHGVIAMSKMQGYYNYDKMLYRANDVDIFITSSEFEKDIIINEMGHPKDNVYVTGLSRFDNLYKHSSQRGEKIVYIPTWRNWLKNSSDEVFINSQYFKETSAVINMLTRLKEKVDLEIEICFHHALDKYTHLYHLDNSLTYVDMSLINVQELIIDTALLITDFSSISFDLAYLEKPVIFYQFDTEEFLDVRGGSFIDYENELFGEKLNDIDSLENKINEYIDNDYIMFDTDKEKARRYFSYRDDKNSERIYNTIKEKLDEKRS